MHAKIILLMLVMVLAPVGCGELHGIPPRLCLPAVCACWMPGCEEIKGQGSGMWGVV